MEEEYDVQEPTDETTSDAASVAAPQDLTLDQAYDRIASAYGVPTSVWKSMVHQESGGRIYGKNGQLLTSNKGALGAWQIMPDTFKLLGYKSEDIHDPLKAAEAGLRYLSNNYKLFRNAATDEMHAWQLALGAYNAGEHRPQFKQGKLPPFKETINYVRSISSRIDPNSLDRSPLQSNGTPTTGEGTVQAPQQQTQFEYTPGSNASPQTWTPTPPPAPRKSELQPYTANGGYVQMPDLPPVPRQEDYARPQQPLSKAFVPDTVNVTTTRPYTVPPTGIAGATAPGTDTSPQPGPQPGNQTNPQTGVQPGAQPQADPVLNQFDYYTKSDNKKNERWTDSGFQIPKEGRTISAYDLARLAGGNDALKKRVDSAISQALDQNPDASPLQVMVQVPTDMAIALEMNRRGYAKNSADPLEVVRAMLRAKALKFDKDGFMRFGKKEGGIFLDLQRPSSIGVARSVINKVKSGHPDYMDAATLKDIADSYIGSDLGGDPEFQAALKEGQQVFAKNAPKVQKLTDEAQSAFQRGDARFYGWDLTQLKQGLPDPIRQELFKVLGQRAADVITDQEARDKFSKLMKSGKELYGKYRTALQQKGKADQEAVQSMERGLAGSAGERFAVSYSQNKEKQSADQFNISDAEVQNAIKETQKYALSDDERKGIKDFALGKRSTWYHNAIVAGLSEAGAGTWEIVNGLTRPFQSDEGFTENVKTIAGLREFNQELKGRSDRIPYVSTGLQTGAFIGGELPTFIALSRIPGVGVVPFALKEALNSAGRGDNVEGMVKSAALGGVTDALFAGANGLGNVVRNAAFKKVVGSIFDGSKTAMADVVKAAEKDPTLKQQILAFGRQAKLIANSEGKTGAEALSAAMRAAKGENLPIVNLKEAVKLMSEKFLTPDMVKKLIKADVGGSAAARWELARKIAPDLTRIGTITAGNTAITKGEGMDWEKSAASTAELLAIDSIFHYGGKAAGPIRNKINSAAGRIFEIILDNKKVKAVLDPQGGVYRVNGDIDPALVDAKLGVDPSVTFQKGQTVYREQKGPDGKTSVIEGTVGHEPMRGPFVSYEGAKGVAKDKNLGNWSATRPGEKPAPTESEITPGQTIYRTVKTDGKTVMHKGTVEPDGKTVKFTSGNMTVKSTIGQGWSTTPEFEVGGTVYRQRTDKKGAKVVDEGTVLRDSRGVLEVEFTRGPMTQRTKLDADWTPTAPEGYKPLKPVKPRKPATDEGKGEKAPPDASDKRLLPEPTLKSEPPPDGTTVKRKFLVTKGKTTNLVDVEGRVSSDETGSTVTYTNPQTQRPVTEKLSNFKNEAFNSKNDQHAVGWRPLKTIEAKPEPPVAARTAETSTAAQAPSTKKYFGVDKKGTWDDASQGKGDDSKLWQFDVMPNGKAKVRFNDNPEAHKQARMHPETVLNGASEQVGWKKAEERDRVHNIEDGEAVLENGQWRITKKPKVSFQSPEELAASLKSAETSKTQETKTAETGAAKAEPAEAPKAESKAEETKPPVRKDFDSDTVVTDGKRIGKWVKEDGEAPYVSVEKPKGGFDYLEPKGEWRKATEAEVEADRAAKQEAKEKAKQKAKSAERAEKGEKVLKVGDKVKDENGDEYKVKKNAEGFYVEDKDGDKTYIADAEFTKDGAEVSENGKYKAPESKRPTDAKAKGKTAESETETSSPKFPKIEDVPSINAGPFSHKPKPINKGRPLFSEMNVTKADNLLYQEDHVAPASLFVSDNPDLALGQGNNKGVIVKFRPDSLSGRENRKPALGIASGREFIVDGHAPRAIESITFRNPTDVKLGFISKVYLRERFDRTNNPDGSVTFTRKGLKSSEHGFKEVPQQYPFDVSNETMSRRAAERPTDSKAKGKIANRDTAFKELANQQRGAPEGAMRDIQKAHSGVYGYLVEHIGDLIHRMSEFGDRTMNSRGAEYIDSKLRGALRTLTRGRDAFEMPFEQEHQQNIENNAKARGISTKQQAAKLKKLGEKYASEHEQLPVYNEAQSLAREAAVALGRMDFDTAEAALTKLDKLFNNGKTDKEKLDNWTKEANKFDQNYGQTRREAERPTDAKAKPKEEGRSGDKLKEGDKVYKTDAKGNKVEGRVVTDKRTGDLTVVIDGAKGPAKDKDLSTWSTSEPVSEGGKMSEAEKAQRRLDPDIKARIRAAVDAGEDLAKVAAKFGVPVEVAEAIRLKNELGPFGQATFMIRKAIKDITSGVGDELLSALGLAGKEVNTTSRDQIADMVMDALARRSNPYKRRSSHLSAKNWDNLIEFLHGKNVSRRTMEVIEEAADYQSRYSQAVRDLVEDPRYQTLVKRLKEQGVTSFAEMSSKDTNELQMLAREYGAKYGDRTNLAGKKAPLFTQDDAVPRIINESLGSGRKRRLFGEIFDGERPRDAFSRKAGETEADYQQRVEKLLQAIDDSRPRPNTDIGPEQNSVANHDGTVSIGPNREKVVSAKYGGLGNLEQTTLTDRMSKAEWDRAGADFSGKMVSEINAAIEGKKTSAEQIKALAEKADWRIEDGVLYMNTEAMALFNKAAYGNYDETLGFYKHEPQPFDSDVFNTLQAWGDMALADGGRAPYRLFGLANDIAEEMAKTRSRDVIGVWETKGHEEMRMAVLQEEFAHRADLRLRYDAPVEAGRGLDNIFDDVKFGQLKPVAKAVANLKKGDYGNITDAEATTEVIAKSFIDGGHLELGLTQKEVAQIRRAYAKELWEKGYTVEEVAKNFGADTPRLKEFADFYETQVKTFERSAADGTRGKGEPDAGASGSGTGRRERAAGSGKAEGADAKFKQQAAGRTVEGRAETVITTPALKDRKVERVIREDGQYLRSPNHREVKLTDADVKAIMEVDESMRSTMEDAIYLANIRDGGFTYAHKGKKYRFNDDAVPEPSFKDRFQDYLGGKQMEKGWGYGRRGGAALYNLFRASMVTATSHDFSSVGRQAWDLLLAGKRRTLHLNEEGLKAVEFNRKLTAKQDFLEDEMGRLERLLSPRNAAEAKALKMYGGKEGIKRRVDEMTKEQAALEKDRIQVTKAMTEKSRHDLLLSMLGVSFSSLPSERVTAYWREKMRNHPNIKLALANDLQFGMVKPPTTGDMVTDGFNTGEVIDRKLADGSVVEMVQMKNGKLVELDSKWQVHGEDAGSTWERFGSKWLGESPVLESKYGRRTLGDAIEGTFKRGELDNLPGFMAHKARRTATWSVRAFQRFFDTGIAWIRFKHFNAMVSELQAKAALEGKQVDPEAVKYLAKTINQWTGFVRLGKFDGVVPYTNHLLFSTRLAASRLAAYDPRFYTNAPEYVRAYVNKGMARQVGWKTGLLMAGALAGGRVIWDDPTDPGAFRLKFGDYSYDLSAGHVQYLIFAARVAQALYEWKAQGEIKTAKDLKQIQQDANVMQRISGLAIRLLEKKLGTVPSAIVQGATGKTVMGDPTTFGEAMSKAYVPIFLGNMQQYMADGDQGMASAALDLLGFGVTRLDTIAEIKQKRAEMLADPELLKNPVERKRRNKIFMNKLRYAEREATKERKRQAELASGKRFDLKRALESYGDDLPSPMNPWADLRDEEK